MRHTRARVLAVVSFAGLLLSPALTVPLSAAGSGGEGTRPADPRVLPVDATYKGLTYGDWLAVGWQELLAIAEQKGRQPLITGGAVGLNNGMVLLSAPILELGADTVTIPVTVPYGQYLSVGLISVECSVAEAPPFHGEDEADLRACANGLLDMVSIPDLYAAIDGRPVEHPGTFRTESPLFRYGPLPEGNPLHLPARTQSDAVAAGYGLLLSPLGVGVHRIAVRAAVPAFGIAVDANFIVTVEPPRGR
jgi:hypothetical protein